MTIKLSVTVQNSVLNVIESSIGVSAVLKIYELSGSAPSTCEEAISGTVLSTIQLPSDWMQNASSGNKLKNGAWLDGYISNTGTANFFRLFASNGVTCHAQGTVSTAGNGGDLIVNYSYFIANKSFIINSFKISVGGI